MSLPSAASESLILTKATQHEKVYIWTRHQSAWGPRLTPQAYVDREEHIVTQGSSKDGDFTTWILTDPTSTSTSTDARPILSAVETHHKRAIVRDPDGTIRDVTAYGLASVFTFDEFRRRGYASRMFHLLGETLATWQAKQPGSAEFSILFSDIGKHFYSQHRWVPFPSSHLSFATRPFTTPHDHHLTLVTADNLQTLVQLDEQTLRRKMASPPSQGHKVRAAILPDIATYRWHLARESFMSNYLLGRSPTVHGAMYTPVDAPDCRVWMLWSCVLHGGTETPAENVVNILHYAVERDAISDDDLSRALGAIMGVAHTNAHDWLCAKIDMWNPDERTQRLLADITHLQGELVVRQTKSIPCLRWFGQGAVSEVEWVDNEKFGWC